MRRLRPGHAQTHSSADSPRPPGETLLAPSGAEVLTRLLAAYIPDAAAATLRKREPVARGAPSMAEDSAAASPSRRRLSEKALSGLSRLSESIPRGRRLSRQSQEAMCDEPRGGHHYVRIHDSARKCDILFLVPTQHLVEQGMLFSARVHFERPDPEPGFVERCAKAGIPDGWARRALSAGRRLPEDVYEWVQQQQHPPASGCKMTIIEEVPPGEYASTTLSSGEHVRVELPAGAIAGQELLFVLPPTTPQGCAPRLPKPAPLAAAAAAPHPVTLGPARPRASHGCGGGASLAHTPPPQPQPRPRQACGGGERRVLRQEEGAAQPHGQAQLAGALVRSHEQRGAVLRGGRRRGGTPP